MVVDLDYNVSSLPNFLFSFFGFRFRRELDNKEYEIVVDAGIKML